MNINIERERQRESDGGEGRLDHKQDFDIKFIEGEIVAMQCSVSFKIRFSFFIIWSVTICKLQIRNSAMARLILIRERAGMMIFIVTETETKHNIFDEISPH